MLVGWLLAELRRWSKGEWATSGDVGPTDVKNAQCILMHVAVKCWARKQTAAASRKRLRFRLWHCIDGLLVVRSSYSFIAECKRLTREGRMAKRIVVAKPTLRYLVHCPSFVLSFFNCLFFYAPASGSEVAQRTCYFCSNTNGTRLV